MRMTMDVAGLNLSCSVRGALHELMNFPGPALVNVKLSLGSSRKPQQFRWHS